MSGCGNVQCPLLSVGVRVRGRVAMKSGATTIYFIRMCAGTVQAGIGDAYLMAASVFLFLRSRFFFALAPSGPCK